ncbi:MAG TPA: ABC transporter permease [Acetobacteraceae bacterium]|jgi:ABC-type spermidine/putrescine transport system permease subunit I|nr:ABC transporter permease [Acetobacteraceae bacterium]
MAVRALPASAQLCSPYWLLLPVGLLYGALALLPIAVILRLGLRDGGSPLRAVLRSPLLLRAIENTVVISLLTTVIAVLLGLLLAAAVWRAGPRLRAVLWACILLPFWTGVLIKNFAWASLLQDNGVVNTLLQTLGLADAPVTLLHNRFAVIVGMVHYVLPYAVFPIYTTLRAIDPALERAARSLGAGRRGVIWWVVLPLARSGLSNAALLVFIISCGFFITPVILGAPSDLMIANLVDYYVHDLVDFDRAAALSLLILAAIAALIGLQQALPKEGQHGTA